MKSFVTGASGFLGRRLVQALRERGDEVTAVSSRECDLREATALRAFNGLAFDRIFHLAAWTQAGSFCLHHPGEQWIINQQINTHVLAWWQQHQPGARQISIGTSCAYDPNLTLTEENYLVGKPIESLFTYAMTKRMLYAGQLALRSQFGLRSLTAVPSTLYGTDYRPDGRQKHFIFDLIEKIWRGHLLGTEVVLWGDGQQRRELVEVGDFVRLLLQLDDRGEEGLVNIGAGVDHSIREFAEMICAQVGYDPARIRYDTSQYVGARSKILSVAKLDRLLPGRPITPLADGLAETIAWMRAAR